MLNNWPPGGANEGILQHVEHISMGYLCAKYDDFSITVYEIYMNLCPYPFHRRPIQLHDSKTSI